jgi:hypothetical protein
MKVEDHDDARINRNAKIARHSPPKPHVQVVAEEPLQDQVPCLSVERGQDQHHGFRGGMENQVQ